MADIVLFHHAGGLTDGVVSFADTLRGAGHTVHTPDLFAGRTFSDVEDGVAHAQSLGDELGARVTAALAGLPSDVVYGGMSMGTGRAAEQVLERPGARGAFFLYGAIDPAWWDATWPADVPTQAHVTDEDEWREPEAEEEYVKIPGAELFVYHGKGHLFLEPGHPDFDEDAARLTTERVLSFVASL